jgi:hypothetical protein
MLLEETVEVLEPLDTHVIDLTLTAREAYVLQETLYFDKNSDPYEVLDLLKYITDRLLDCGLPADREEFTTEYVNDHSDNEQYKRMVFFDETER